MLNRHVFIMAVAIVLWLASTAVLLTSIYNKIEYTNKAINRTCTNLQTGDTFNFNPKDITNIIVVGNYGSFSVTDTKGISHTFTTDMYDYVECFNSNEKGETK